MHLEEKSMSPSRLFMAFYQFLMQVQTFHVMLNLATIKSLVWHVAVPLFSPSNFDTRHQDNILTYKHVNPTF